MLGAEFRFSQGSLQDYVACPRRFQLKYFAGQAWPAVETEPFLQVEQHFRRGARFHRLVERHQLGVSEELLISSVADDESLRRWWLDYLAYEFLHTLEGERIPEFQMSGDISGKRLVAQADLVVIQPGARVYLFDWKTYSRLPSREWLARRLQTRVYCYLAAWLGVELFGEWFLPEHLTMIYWVVGDAGGGEYVFPYSQLSFVDDAAYLGNLVDEIVGRIEYENDRVWPLALSEAHCRNCVYRSLCDRGMYAGVFGESNEVDNSVFGVGLPDFRGVDELGF